MGNDGLKHMYQSTCVQLHVRYCRCAPNQISQNRKCKRTTMRSSRTNKWHRSIAIRLPPSVPQGIESKATQLVLLDKKRNSNFNSPFLGILLPAHAGRRLHAVIADQELHVGPLAPRALDGRRFEGVRHGCLLFYLSVGNVKRTAAQSKGAIAIKGKYASSPSSHCLIMLTGTSTVGEAKVLRERR